MNILLIGFMGAGKSKIAKTLSRTYGFDTVEMDETIEEREGMSIPEIFEKMGEEYFRNKETELLMELKEKEATVISCGGGTPLREENVLKMREIGKLVFLKTTPKTILKRVENSNNRPLLEGNKNEEFIANLLEKRLPKYQGAADIIVDTDDRYPKEICEEIMIKCGLNTEVYNG